MPSSKCRGSIYIWRPRALKILHVQQTLSPSYGGPATLLPQLARAQAEAGHKVTIVTTNADYPSGIYREPGWTILEGTSVAIYFASVQFNPLSISAGMALYLRREITSFDIVHVHGLYRFPSTYVAYLARKHNVPYVICPHGSLDPHLYNQSAHNLRLKRLYERWFDLPNLQRADAIHYTAEEEREQASFLRLTSPTFVVPNGLNWDRYLDLPQRGALRARLSLGEAPIVLFVGRIHPVKGLDILIPAFDALQSSVPSVQLVIVGAENDSYGKQVRAWVQDRNLVSSVHFVGELRGVEVTQAYVDADVFSLPSYTENFGMVVAEAMACALPVVISDQVKIHKAVSQAGAGLVTPCDVTKLAAALETLLTRPERRQVMGAAGRMLVQKNYNWPTIVEMLTTEYKAAIKRHDTHNKRIRNSIR